MSAGGWTSWTDAVWSCIELMGISVGSTFTLEEIYKAEEVLGRIYPKNSLIKSKIRQQLQVMRDHDKLEFVNDNGIYRRIS